MHVPRRDRQGVGDHLGEGRFAGPIDPQKANAVVDIQAQIEAFQDRRAVIADADPVQPDQGRRQRTMRRGQGEGRGAFGLHFRGRRQLGQHLQPRLGLGGLGRRGAEAVDEGLHMGALGLDLGAHGVGQAQFFGALHLETVIAAGIEIQLAVAHMQDEADRIVQKLAVVADDQGVVGIFLEARLEPQGAFKVEIVGRFVEQQKVGFGEQGRGQGHPHAPAAGELGHGPGQVGGRKAQARQDFGGPRRRPVGVDLDQPAIDFTQALRGRGVKFGGQGRTLHIGGQYGVQKADRRRRMLLVHRGDLGRLGQLDLAAALMKLAQDQLEQGRFADAIAADQAHLGVLRQGDAGVVKEPAPPGVEYEFGNLQHGKLGCALAGGKRTAISPRPFSSNSP